jgi:hypothetical protein
MARKSATRRRRASSRKNGGVTVGRRAYAPFAHVMNATGNSVRQLSRTAGNVVRNSLLGVRKLGNIWVKHTNMALRNVTRRGGRR